MTVAHAPAQPTSHAGNGFVVLITVIAALGGLLFGFDQGVISGAIGFLSSRFQMDAGLSGFVTASLSLGAIAGCLIAGFLCDGLGRRLLMFIGAVLFIVSSIGCGLAAGPAMLIVFRVIGGLGVGVVSTVVPLYIAEIAPAKIRGRLVGGYQLAIASGILLVYIVNALIANTHALEWNLESGWRWMFAAGVVPGVLFFVLMFLVPETPRFLFEKGQAGKARAILTRIQGSVDAEKSLVQFQIVQDGPNKGFFRELFKKGFGVALVLTIGLSFFQQLTGVSAVAYYAPVIFKQAGASTSVALIETVVVGVVKVLFVVSFMILVDRVGRKRLLVWGTALMALCLIGIGAAFSTPTPMSLLTDGVILALILLHTVGFEASWGPGIWVVISELWPTRIRGRAASIGSSVLWLGTYLVTQFFPILLEKWGTPMTFVLFGFFCLVMCVFTYKLVPENKGKTLEQIQVELTTAGAKN
ncbi:sugar porter family MFS transporter [Cryobacterium sp. GrIS_2_6]|uniref:sugar porter family MFS transporter n=1 Tax=Cryobacterium sp. GrIS_2_6 TaxID=3162785 RepID=UPI002E001B27|nr:sugar porter family MFS transporter [Cryobacterium psychrotolerans]MEC5152026.1 SP family arabinose:H+ symporter-like MFS transporter [Cryobacterium psychrotolerans]